MFSIFEQLNWSLTGITMGKVDNPIDTIIQKKGFGIWPQDVVQVEQDDPLITALNIEYRFQQHLTINKLDGLIPLQNPDSKIDLLIEESKSLLTLSSGLDPITKFILLINVGHFKFIQNQINDSIDILKAADLNFGSQANNYIQSLFYRKHFLLANSYHQLQDFTNEEKWLITGVNFFDKIPTLSNIESLKWLNLIYSKILRLISTPTVSKLDKFFQNKNFIMSFIDYSIDQGIKYDSKELINFVTTRSNSLLSSTKFPKSDELNNYELEEFLSQVNDCKLIKPELNADLIEKGINKTYQSHILLRALTKNLLILGKKKESYHGFEVYVDYIERYYVQNNNSFNDILSILNTFKLMLSFRFRGNKSSDDLTLEEYDRYVSILNKFKKVLGNFYDDNGVLKIEQDFDLLDEDSLLLNVNNDKLRQFLSEIWYTLAISNIRLYKSSYSIFPKNESILKESIGFFKNSIYNDYKNDEIILQYVKFIATLRKIKESYSILKNFLTKQTVKNLTFFKSWHLLALIVSIEENKDESFKIINFLINEIDEFLELTQGESLSIELKNCFIQIKITHLSIIESLLGVEQSLDSLPELFALYNNLFKEPIVQESEKIESKSNQLHRTSTLAKIKSIRSHKEVKTTPAPAPPTIKISIEQAKLLQQIWLVTSTIYSKANLFEDAQQAVLEAEKSYKQTSETLTTLGLISIVDDPQLSLKSFEKALDIDRDYSLAIIGLSNLFLHQNSAQVKIFVNEKDSRAAIARVKILLELLTERFNSSMISEVWYLLSQIYEEYGDKKRFRDALWKSVDLEETRPIRDFSYV